jgi:hypothetical protein
MRTFGDIRRLLSCNPIRRSALRRGEDRCLGEAFQVGNLCVVNARALIRRLAFAAEVHGPPTPACPWTELALGTQRFKDLDWITRGRVLLRGDARLGR